jgi:hypothetical protein
METFEGKKTTLNKVADGQLFRLAPTGTKYKMIRKDKTSITFTSESSTRSYCRKPTTVVYIAHEDYA